MTERTVITILITIVVTMITKVIAVMMMVIVMITMIAIVNITILHPTKLNLQIANDGTIPFREGSFKERVQLSYYFTQRFATDSVDLQVLLTFLMAFFVPTLDVLLSFPIRKIILSFFF